MEVFEQGPGLSGTQVSGPIVCLLSLVHIGFQTYFVHQPGRHTLDSRPLFDSVLFTQDRIMDSIVLYMARHLCVLPPIFVPCNRPLKPTEPSQFC